MAKTSTVLAMTVLMYAELVYGYSHPTSSEKSVSSFHVQNLQVFTTLKVTKQQFPSDFSVRAKQFYLKVDLLILHIVCRCVRIHPSFFFFLMLGLSLCRCEAPGGRVSAQAPRGGGGRRQEPAELGGGRRGCPEEAQNAGAQTGLPLLPVQQDLPEQQQPQPAHPLSRLVPAQRGWLRRFQMENTELLLVVQVISCSSVTNAISYSAVRRVLSSTSPTSTARMW